MTTVRRGREKLHYLNAAPINEISERWINRYDQERVLALADLKRALEETPMQKPSFAYTTYIKTTPERLWQALTDPAFTERYWSTTFETDWQVGSTMTWHNHGRHDRRPRAGRPRIRALSPALLHLAHLHARAGRGPRASPTRCSPRRPAKPDRRSRSRSSRSTSCASSPSSTTASSRGAPSLELVSGGWPHVLSDLKTLLETGETLPAHG